MLRAGLGRHSRPVAAEVITMFNMLLDHLRFLNQQCVDLSHKSSLQETYELSSHPRQNEKTFGFVAMSTFLQLQTINSSAELGQDQ